MNRLLQILMMTFALIFGASSAAQAGKGGAVFSYGEQLLFVQDLNSDRAAYRSTSLCQLVDYADVFFLPIYVQPKSYVLSHEGCKGTGYLPLVEDRFNEYQSKGLIDAQLTFEPVLSLKWKVFGHLAPIFLVTALVFRVLIWFRHGKGRRKKSSDALTVNMLAAMSAVAVSDGCVDEREVYHIALQFTNLTGRDIDHDHIRDLLYETRRLGPDLESIGNGLKGKEAHLVMQAALTTVVIDRNIDDSEYTMVSQIATKLGIKGAEFRKALERAKTDMAMA